ncbi:homocysteine S-methyltransferase family protein [Spiribacter insolitus]|uniref:Homocysteine S-methyltransferase family protein n=1 Tax=Spiribacter insolitus TaxID=3122417 RepID=A0ABV3T6U7_9GAMM
MTEHTITLLDGGMGQELRKRMQAPATPLWSAQVMRDEPDLVAAVHRDYIAAGADVITVNTYVATPQRLARDGDPAWFDSLQKAALDAAHSARDKSDRRVRIAGCLPPLVASYHAELVPDDATCQRDYARLVEVQAGGVDLFIAETMSLTREAVAAAHAGRQSGRPVWIAFTVDDQDGTRLRSGEPLADAASAVVEAGADAVLINCSAPEAVTTAMPILAGRGVPFGGYANGFEAAAELEAGGTVDALTARESMTPAVYAGHVRDWIDAGATIVGGCCEIGPAHIAALHRRFRSPGPP